MISLRQNVSTRRRVLLGLCRNWSARLLTAAILAYVPAPPCQAAQSLSELIHNHTVVGELEADDHELLGIDVAQNTICGSLRLFDSSMEVVVWDTAGSVVFRRSSAIPLVVAAAHRARPFYVADVSKNGEVLLIRDDDSVRCIGRNGKDLSQNQVSSTPEISPDGVYWIPRRPKLRETWKMFAIFHTVSGQVTVGPQTISNFHEARFVTSNRIVVRAFDFIRVLDAENGQQVGPRVTTDPYETMLSPLAVSANALAFGVGGGQVRVMSPDGDSLWTTSIALENRLNLLAICDWADDVAILATEPETSANQLWIARERESHAHLTKFSDDRGDGWTEIDWVPLQEYANRNLLVLSSWERGLTKVLLIDSRVSEIVDSVTLEGYLKPIPGLKGGFAWATGAYEDCRIHGSRLREATYTELSVIRLDITNLAR